VNDFETTLTQALNHRVDTLVGERRPAPRFEPSAMASLRSSGRRWIAPLVVAAVVVLIVVVTTALVSSTAHNKHVPPAVSTEPAPSPTADAPSSTSSSPATSGSPTTSISTPGPTGAQPVSVTLGPAGFGALKLGLNVTEAQQSGAISGLATQPSIAQGDACDGIFLAAISTRPAGSVDGYISAKYGVVYISAPPGVRTPEGVGVGSTLSAVRAAYPNLTEQQGGPTVPVPGNPAAKYLFAYDSTNTIIRVALVAASQDCFS
jgi:hypothetical protein